MRREGRKREEEEEEEKDRNSGSKSSMRSFVLTYSCHRTYRALIWKFQVLSGEALSLNTRLYKTIPLEAS